MFPSGGVSPVASRQLAAWEALAESWPTLRVFDVDAGAWNERCASCFGGLWRVSDDHGTEYAYTGAERLALVVGHLRRSHLDLDPDPADNGR